MGSLANIKNAIYKLLQGAPGKSLLVDLQTQGEDDAELYHLPGFYSRPHDGLTGVFLDVKGMNIVIATHDYKLDFSFEKGEGQIFSYDADGNILSSAKCNKDGEFIVNSGTRDAARKDDATLIDSVTDSAFISWIAAVSSALSITPVPAIITGKINEGTDKVKLP